MAKKKRLPMNFEYGSQGLPGTQKTTFDEIFKGQRRSTLRKTGTHGLKVGDVVEVIAANPRRIGEVKITGIRSVDPSMASELSKTERWKPEFIKNYISKGSFEQISYEPLETSRSKPTALTGTMAKKDDFEAHVRRMQELKESGSIVKNTGPLDLTKYSYKSGKSWSKTPVQNRRLIGDFVSPLKKPFDADILVDQTLKPIKYKGLTGDIEGMSGSQAESGPVKSQQKKVGQKRYIDESKIKTIMSYLSQQVEEIGDRAMESRKPLTKPVENVDRQGNLKKKNIPLRPRQIESGKGKIVLGTEGYQWVADSKGSYPTVTSMSSSGSAKTAFEMVEEAIQKAWKQAVKVGYHEFRTSELKANPRTGKKFDRNIRVNPEAFKQIIQDRLVPTLFAKADDATSSFSLTHEEYGELEKMQGQVVETKEGILLRRSDPRSIDFARREPRGGDAIHWDETVGFRDDGYDPGKHLSGEDISDQNISRGILPGTDPVLGKKLERTKHKQPFLQLDEDPSYLSSMEIDPQKDAAKQLLHGVLMDEVLEDARETQKVQAASATGREEVDQNRVIQRVSEDFEFFDEAEKTRVMEQHNNPITISEESIDKKAVYQESTKLLQEFQQGQVKQLRGVDPILAHLVLRGAQTQKGINPPVQDPGKTVVKKILKAIRFKPGKELPSVEVKPSETIAYPEVQQQKKLSALRTDASLEEKKVDTEARDTKYEQSKQDLKKLNLNKMAASYLAQSGFQTEFSLPNTDLPLFKNLVTGPEPVIAPEAETIVPQKTTSITVDGKSHVLTHNTNIKPGPRSTQLTLGIDPGEVPKIVSNKPSQITEYPSIAHDPKRPLQDQLDMRKPPSVVSGDVDTKNAFPVKRQASLFEGETIDMKKSKLTGDWMTRQEQLRRGEQALHGKINPKLGIFGFGLGLVPSFLSPMVAYKQVQDLNQQEADTHAFADDDPLNPRPVTEEDWKTQFWHRMSGGLTPSVNQLRWQRRFDPGTGVRPDA